MGFDHTYVVSSAWDGDLTVKNEYASSVGLKHISLEDLFSLCDGREVRTVPVSMFAHIFKEDVWKDVFTVENFVYHMHRVDIANLDYPIITVRSGSRLFVLDGMHRLAKCLRYGIEKISCVELGSEYSNLVVLSENDRGSWNSKLQSYFNL